LNDPKRPPGEGVRDMKTLMCRRRIIGNRSNRFDKQSDKQAAIV